MAFAIEKLVSKRMKDLYSVAIGGSVAATSTAIDAVASDLQSTGTGVMFLPNGQLSAAVAAASLDLSDADVCAEAGTVMGTDVTEFCVFVIQDGTNVLCRLGDEVKTVARSSVTGALTTTRKRNRVPADLDNQTYVVTGFVHVVKTVAFTLGTTLFSAVGVTDLYYDTSNLMAGSDAV